jgi:hypothetical protein
MKRARQIVLILSAGLLLSGCGMMRLMKTMLGTSEPNEKILGQRAPRRQEPGAGGRLGRRVRGARPHRRLPCRHGGACVVALHYPAAGGAGERDVGKGGRMGARRRHDMDHRHVRSRAQPALLGEAATRVRTSGAISAPEPISTRTRSSPSCRRRESGAGTTSGPRTTCETTTESGRTSSSSRSGGNCSPTWTRTGTSSSWTAPMDSSSGR